MTDYPTALAAARDALTKLREHDGGTRYNGDDDEVGERACCRVASWKPHDSDCPHAVAVAEFDNLLAAIDAQVPDGCALVKIQHDDRDGFWSFSDNEENFVGEECDTELDAIAAALDYYGDDLETVYVGQAKRIDKARLVRGDHIIELIGDAADEEVGECAYDWPHLSNDECAELERIVMCYVLSKSPAGFFSVEDSREYTREQAEAMLAAAERKGGES